MTKTKVSSEKGECYIQAQNPKTFGKASLMVCVDGESIYIPVSMNAFKWLEEHGVSTEG